MGIGNFRSVNEKRFRYRDTMIKARQERNYNSRHSVKERAPLELFQQVKIVDGSKNKPQVATVVGTNGREVLLEKEGRILRRNRSQIHVLADQTANTNIAKDVTPTYLPDSFVPDAVASSMPIPLGIGEDAHAGVITPAPHSVPVSVSVDTDSPASTVVPGHVRGAVAFSDAGGAVASPNTDDAIAPSCDSSAVAHPQSQSRGGVPSRRSGGVITSPSQPSGVVTLSKSGGVVAPQSSSEVKSTKSGRVVKAPDRLNL